MFTKRFNWRRGSFSDEMNVNPIEPWDAANCRNWLERFEIIMTDEDVTDESPKVVKVPGA